jgi:hypothetical protein
MNGQKQDFLNLSHPAIIGYCPVLFLLSRSFSLKWQSRSCLLQLKVAGDKGISETKSKQQSPCRNCMHRPVTSWGNACSTCMHKPVRCMHWPVMSEADACSYCMGSVVLIWSQKYLYPSYFGSSLFYCRVSNKERKFNNTDSRSR